MAARDEDTAPPSPAVTPTTESTATVPAAAHEGDPHEPAEMPAQPQRRDTLRDEGAEMKALLDGLLPRDGRVLPPRGPVQVAAQSDGRRFVAYAGEAALPQATATLTDPRAKVMVRHSLIGKESLRELVVDSVAEDDERLRDAERERRGAEPTQVIARPRGTWMVLAGAVLVLLVAVAVWALRRDPADVPGVPAPTTATLATAMSAATTVPARALTSAAPVATASAPSIDAVAPAPSSPREPHAAPTAVRVTSPRPMPTPRTTDTVPGAPLPPSKDFTQAPL